MKMKIRVNRDRWVDKAHIYVNDVCVGNFKDPFKEVDGEFLPIISDQEHIEAVLIPGITKKFFSSEQQKRMKEAIEKGFAQEEKQTDNSVFSFLDLKMEFRVEKVFGVKADGNPGKGKAMIYANDVLIGTRSLGDARVTEQELIESIFFPNRLSLLLDSERVKWEGKNLKEALIKGIERKKRQEEEWGREKEKKEKSFDEFVVSFHKYEMMRELGKHFG